MWCQRGKVCQKGNRFLTVTMKKKKISLFSTLLCVVILVLLFIISLPYLTQSLTNKYEEPLPVPTQGSPFKTYYQNLKPIEQKAYTLIIEKIYKMPDFILVPDLNEEELDNVFVALLLDNPDLFFVGRKCSIKSALLYDLFSCEYIISREEYHKQKEELDKKCQEIISALTNINDPWLTELEIHDYIIANCEYELLEKNYTYSSCYGSLINGKAACEGYSKGAKLLLDLVNVESVLIKGSAQGRGDEKRPHMWNMVKLNGDYYHLDLTWDDPVTKKDNAIKVYSYFNIDDKTIGKTHSDFSFDPGCNATDFNYYVRKNLYFDTYSREKEKNIRDIIIAEYNRGERDIQINFASQNPYEFACKELVDKGRIYEVMKNIKTESGEKLGKKLVGYNKNDEFYTLTFVFE